MNEALVRKINMVVGLNDTLYHLGDWSFGGVESISAFRARLNCANIHLVLGNHDHYQHKAPEKFMKGAGFTTFDSIGHYREIVINKQEIVLFHYGLRVWNNQARGSWHLYGHSHGNLPQLTNKSMDVGVDNLAHLGVCGPWSMDEIADMFRTHNALVEDHHTNGSQNHPFGKK
jgi:calcineurin-like phosphoesterase family protein